MFLTNGHGLPCPYDAQVVGLGDEEAAEVVFAVAVGDGDDVVARDDFGGGGGDDELGAAVDGGDDAVGGERDFADDAVGDRGAILENAALVSTHRQGREVLYITNPAPITSAAAWLSRRAESWDVRLARLKRLAES